MTSFSQKVVCCSCAQIEQANASSADFQCQVGNGTPISATVDGENIICTPNKVKDADLELFAAIAALHSDNPNK